MQQRPVGVAVLAVAAAVLGLLALFAAAAWWGASEGLAWLPHIHGVEKMIALVLLAVGLSELLFSFGAWTLRSWAWTLGVVIEVVVLVLAVVQLGRLELIRHLLDIGIAAVVLWYLSTPPVRAAFGRS